MLIARRGANAPSYRRKEQFSAIVSRAGKVVPKVSGAHSARPRSEQRESILEHFAPPRAKSMTS